MKMSIRQPVFNLSVLRPMQRSHVCRFSNVTQLLLADRRGPIVHAIAEPFSGQIRVPCEDSDEVDFAGGHQKGIRDKSYEVSKAILSTTWRVDELFTQFAKALD